TILVPVRGDDKGPGVLAHALAMARRFGAHIDLLHCRARPVDFMPIGVNLPRALREQIRGSASQLSKEEGAALQASLMGIVAEQGIEQIPHEAVAPTDHPTASWFAADGKMADVIRAHGRLADIVAVAKPDRDRNLGVNSLRAALFQTARPVLLCPPDEPAADFLSHIAIAWNGALEATRAVALAQPILRRADRVTVLDGGAEYDAIGGEALLRYLSAHGVQAERKVINAGDSPGRAVLEGAQASGAGMLLCGAYGHSHEHETIFGGATQTIVDMTAMPVMMLH
ncbi:MAG: universal stress protein, partial [Pseudomonadota bacterium]